MQASEKPVVDILSEEKRYYIPGYQRPYSWTEENAKDLATDLLSSFTEKQSEYFLGSIIVIEKEKNKSFEVVDGQQRLTTLSILISVLRDEITDPLIKGDLQKRILPVNVYTGQAGRPRLELRKSEQRFYESTILLEKSKDDEPENEPQTKIKANKAEIKKALSEVEQADLRHFANYLLNNTYFVFVTTDSFQSAYRLFNTLNNRGLDLTNGDLLKNKLYELAGSSDSEKSAIEDLWSDVEISVTLKEMDNFLSHYRTSILANKADRDLFTEFEVIIKDKKYRPSEFCRVAEAAATNYYRIRSIDFDSIKVKKHLGFLLEVSFDDWFPTVLAALNQNFSAPNFEAFLTIVEKVTVQMWVRRLSRSKRNLTYYRLIDAVNLKKTIADLEKVAKETSDNDEFSTLLSSDFYGNQYAQPILLRLDQELQDDSVLKSYNKGITIEHVLPQKMIDDYWTKRFNEKQHRNLVHKIGNMALLSGRKNSAAQGFSFDKKIEVYEKKNKSVSFDITKIICKEKEWSPQIIERRQLELLKQAEGLWKI